MSRHAIHPGSPDGRTPWIVRVAGEVDYTTSGELREEIGQLLTVDHPDRLILDLEGVTHMDSSGLGQLVSIWSSIRNKGGHMTLLNPTQRVQRLFDITRLNTVFEIFDREPDAVAGSPARTRC